MPVVWTPPAVPHAPSFAYWEGTMFAYVTDTAYADGRWNVRVFPSGDNNDPNALYAYVKTEAQGKKYVERWADHNHERIAPPKQRQIMPHEGLKPRKPKGSDDRS
jgi:hypothetical protein